MKESYWLRVGCVLGSHKNSFSACPENALSVSILQYSTASVVRTGKEVTPLCVGNTLINKQPILSRSHTRSRSPYVQAQGQVKKKGVKVHFRDKLKKSFYGIQERTRLSACNDPCHFFHRTSRHFQAIQTTL